MTATARARVGATATFLAAALLPWIGQVVPLDQTPTPLVGYGRAALGALLLLAVLTAPPRRRADPAARWLGLFALVAAVSALLPRPGLTVDTAPYLAGGGPYAVPFPADREMGYLELARLAVVLLAALAGAAGPPGAALAGLTVGSVGIGLRAVREYLLAARGGDPSWRVFAGFTNPNDLAGYLLIAIPVAFLTATAIRDDSGIVRWLVSQQVTRPAAKLRGLVVAGGLALLPALALTGSRGGLLGAGIALLILPLGLGRAGTGRRWLAPAVALLLALAALGPLRARLTAATQAHSLRFRVLTWQGTVDLARHHPLLGVGPGGWDSTYPVYARAAYTQHAHSGWLQVWAETGSFGLAVYVGVFALWLFAAKLACREPDTRSAGLALLAATVGFAVHNTFDHGWYVTATPAALALLGGVVWREVAPEPAARPPRWPTVWGGLAVLFLWVYGAAESARADGQANLLVGATMSAESAFRAATQRASWSSRAYEDLAGVLSWRRQFRAADEAYAVAIARRPGAARLHYRRAATLAEAGQLDAALTESALSLALSPMHLQGYLQLGRMLERAGRSADARRVYEQLDAVAQRPELRDVNPLENALQEPTHAYGLMRLAELADAAGDSSAAASARQRALPLLEAWLAQYEREEQMVQTLPPEERTAARAARGIDAAEARVVRALLEQAREQEPAP